MEYLVDILMPVYNHENFITDALKGVVNQKTNFNFRLLIGEDCSTDKSRSIIEEFRIKYPSIIVPFYREKNLGPYGNGGLLFKEMRSKYIALCEGDDYWLDPLKLQKQIDFLEANPGYSICFHRVYELEPGKEPVLSRLNTSDSPQHYSMEDLSRTNVMMHTLSVVFRNNFPNGLPDWFAQSPAADYTLHMLNASHGKIYYMPEPMGVYRKFVGIWGTQAVASRQLNWYKTMRCLISHFDQNASETILHNLRRQQASSLVYLYENDAAETVLLHEPLVKEVLDLVTVKSADEMTRYSTKLLVAGLCKKVFSVLRHNPVGNRVARILK